MSFDLKICKKCDVAKPLEAFSICSVEGAKKVKYRASCKECRKPIVKNSSRIHRENNIEKAREASKKYYQDNKLVQNAKNKEYRKIWDVENADKLRKQAVNRERKLRENPVYRLRTNVSRSVREALSIQGKKKGWRSFFEYVNYTNDELKEYLEKQFESWMTWDNYGTYDTTSWKDNDQSTWTWQLDHIIPQSDLLYTSMDEENFKKCWALENLRPYSAKQNNIDGATRTRHKDKNVI